MVEQGPLGMLDLSVVDQHIKEDTRSRSVYGLSPVNLGCTSQVQKPSAYRRDAGDQAGVNIAVYFTNPGLPRTELRTPLIWIGHAPI